MATFSSKAKRDEYLQGLKRSPSVVPSGHETTATIACPDAVLVCARCEAKVHRLKMLPGGSVCDECLPEQS